MLPEKEFLYQISVAIFQTGILGGKIPIAGFVMSSTSTICSHYIALRKLDDFDFQTALKYYVHSSGFSGCEAELGKKSLLPILEKQKTLKSLTR